MVKDSWNSIDVARHNYVEDGDCVGLILEFNINLPYYLGMGPYARPMRAGGTNNFHYRQFPFMIERNIDTFSQMWGEGHFVHTLD
jgi:hypothetical protein